MILREKNESIEDYKIRLYRYKEVYDLSFAEIGDLLNKETGNNFSESAYRKPMTSYLEGYEDGFADGASEEGYEMSEELRELKDEIKKEKIKLSDQRRMYNANLRFDARAEHLTEHMQQSIERLHVYKPFEIWDAPSLDTEKIGVLQISDWHIGEVVDNYLNQYNVDIAREYVKNITQDVIQYAKEEEISKLIILNQGDMIAGNIRVTARIENEEHAIKQAMIASEIMTDMLQEVNHALNYLDIEFISVTDNHSRLTANFRENIERENFQMLIPWYLSARIGNHPKIQIKESKINGIDEVEIGQFEIFDEIGFVVHGHKDNIKNIIPDLSMLNNKQPIAIFMGHIHRNYEDEEFNIDLIVCPSLVGLGEYSKSIRRQSQSRQKMTIFEKRPNGKVYRKNTYMLYGQGR